MMLSSASWFCFAFQPCFSLVSLRRISVAFSFQYIHNDFNCFSFLQDVLHSRSAIQPYYCAAFLWARVHLRISRSLHLVMKYLGIFIAGFSVSSSGSYTYHQTIRSRLRPWSLRQAVCSTAYSLACLPRWLRCRCSIILLTWCVTHRP